MCFEVSGEPIRQLQLKELDFQRLNEHDKEVTVLRIDSELLYSIDRGGNFHIWEIGNPKNVVIKYKFPVCEHGLESLCYDDEYIYIGGVYTDSKIWIWDKNDLREEAVLTHHPNSILDMSVKNSTLVCASADGSISIIEIPNWYEPQILETDQKILQAVEIDKHRIYAGGIGNKVSIFRIDNHDLITELVGHDATIFSLSVDEEFIYSGSGEIWWGGPGSPRPLLFESAVRVWEKSNWECVSILDGHKDNINDITIDDANIYSVSDDGTIRIYSKEDWSQKIVIEIDQRINAITTNADSIYIACGDASIIQIDKRSFPSL